MSDRRPSSPSPSVQTNRSTTTTSSRDPSASIHSRTTSNEASMDKAFSVVVSLLSNVRPAGSSPDSILPITRLIQKRKSTSAALKLPASADEFGLPDDSDSSTLYRVLQPKPSMLSMPSSKNYEKAKRVRLYLAPDRSPVLEVRDEVKDKVLHAVDVSRIEARTIHAVDRAQFHLPNVLFVPIAARTRGKLSAFAPPSPSVPAFSPDVQLERATSLALSSRGPYPSGVVGATSDGRRPSTASATNSSIPYFGGSTISGPSSAAVDKGRAKDDHGLYLHFESSTSLRSWLALLQSKAVHDIYYCPPVSPSVPITPGKEVPVTVAEPKSRPFRLRREVKITVGEARLLLQSAASSAASSNNSSYADLRSPLTPATPAYSSHPYAQFGHAPIVAAAASTPAQHDVPGVYVELLSGQHSIARTTLKRHSAAPLWEESFTFPFFSVLAAAVDAHETLRLVVWKEKSIGKHSVHGSVEIPLGGWFPAGGQGEASWWPVLHESGRRVGDLRLKVQVTEQVVFPLSRYGDLASLTHRAIDGPESAMAAAFWRKDIDQSLAAHTIMRVATVRGKVEEVVGAMVARENLSAETLFRSNTPFTKSIDAFLKEFLVPSFIPHALSRTIQRVMDDKLAIEILSPAASARHPSSDRFDQGERHLSESQRREMERQRRELRKLVEDCWSDVYAARNKVPEHVREALRKIFEAVPPEAKWRGITTLFFLRLITPAIVDPHSFGLTLAVPDGATRRTLLLLAKALSALSYGGLSDKQPEMHLAMGAFAAERHEQVVDFIAFVTRKDDDVPSVRGRDVVGIDGFLSRGCESKTGDAAEDLVQESLLIGPFYLDAAADLAVLANLLHRAFVAIDEDSDTITSPYPELAALVEGIIRDEQDALEFLMLSRMPASFRPRCFVSNFISASTHHLPPLEELNRPSTRSSRSQTISEGPSLLQPVREGFGRHRSGSSSTVVEEDATSTFSHATLDRKERAALTNSINAGRRPSLPAALLATRSPNPVFGLKSVPQTARKWTESSSRDDSDDDDDDDWERDERHFAGQRATFSAKINQQLLTSSLSVDAVGPTTSMMAGPMAGMSQDDAIDISTAGRKKWRKVWNLKL